MKMETSHNKKIVIKKVNSKKIQNGEVIYKGRLFNAKGKCLGDIPYLENTYPIITFYGVDFDELERVWQKSQIRLTDKELLEIFPEAKKMIPEKLEELEEKKENIISLIKKGLQVIKEKVTPGNQWFWREWVKVNEGQELLKIDKNIARFKRLLAIAKNKKVKGQITEEQKQQALAVPIESLINQSLRKSGRALVGLCPFHSEKHPSFYIYPETDSCWCYGCNQGGDVINFVRLLYGYSFKEAVRYLIGEK